MKNGFFLTFGLFALSQLLLLLVSENDNIASGSEIIIITLVIAFFAALFFAGYRWARWVAAILLGLVAIILASMTLEGFGFGYLAIAFLYGAVIIALFRHRPEINHQSTTHESAEAKESFASRRPIPKDGFYVGEDVYKYPLLVKRYQSLFIDSMLLLFIMVVTMVIMGESEARPTVMISLGVIFLLAYEPLLTTYSATLGQYVLGIRVRYIKNPSARINIFQAYARIIVKCLLGWLSFVTIHFNVEHRAIHDIAGSSVVIRVK